MRDRTVHGWTGDGGEIVRYDRAGKWYIEYPSATLVPRRAVSVRAAARAAAGIRPGLPGGRIFAAAFNDRSSKDREPSRACSGEGPMTSTITRWSCPECGREFGSAPVSDETIGDPIHSPKWSAEFERNPQPCRGTPVARTYVAVDALLSDEALDAAQDAVAIEHPGSLTDIEHCAQAAIRAALASTGVALSEEEV